MTASGETSPMEFAPKAHESSRGLHPDFQHGEDGSLEFRDDVSGSAADRDLNRAMTDPARHAHRMAAIAEWQARQPTRTQDMVAGVEYYGTFAEGERNYLAQVRAQNQQEAEWQGKKRYVDDEMLRGMSLAEYAECFDDNGRPRDHVLYHANRSLRLDGSIDTYTAQELQRRAQQP